MTEKDQQNSNHLTETKNPKNPKAMAEPKKTFLGFDVSRSLSLLMTGFFMGSADLIPGVSGGTIAFISGIYEELIDSIKNGFSVSLPLFLRGKVVESIQSVNWQLFIPLGLGIATAIVSLSGLVEYVLTDYPAMTWAFFFGLVVASIATVLPKVKKITPINIIGFILGAVSMYLLVAAVPVETPSTWWAFILSGMLAICAMILPGISGSFILLILGKYQQVLGAVNDRDFLTLFLVALGCAIGIGLFSQILDYIFKKYHDLTVSVLAGVLLGSLRKVWPWKETVQTYLDSHGKEVPLVQINVGPDSIQSLIIAILLACLGFAFVVGFEWIQHNTRKDNTHV